MPIIPDLSSWTNCSTELSPYIFDICSLPPGIEGSKHPYFHEMLCQWATAYYPQFHWIALIEPQNITYLRQQITETVPQTYEPSYAGKWDIQGGFDATFNDQTQKTIGCIFANSVKIPGDSVSTEISAAYRGFATGILTGNRDYPHKIDISFNETITSFTDSVLRPWTILTSYKGLIARKQDESIKATITIYELSPSQAECEPNGIRKTITFYDCAPISVTGCDLKQDTTLMQFDCSFAFNNYTIKIT